jgi:hypothetical protein
VTSTGACRLPRERLACVGKPQNRSVLGLPDHASAILSAPRASRDRLDASLRSPSQRPAPKLHLCCYPTRAPLPSDDGSGRAVFLVDQHVVRLEDEYLADQIRLLVGVAHHCGDLPDYFLEVFDAKVVRGPPDDPDGGLGALLDRWLKFFENRVFPGGCFIISSSVEFASRSGPVRDALAAAVDLEIAVLERAVRRANELAETQAERDVSQTTFELHSILMEAHALFEVKKDPAVFERARAAIHRLVGELD